MIVVGLLTSIPLKAVRTMWYQVAILSLGQKVITSIATSKFNIHNFSGGFAFTLGAIFFLIYLFIYFFILLLCAAALL
jgi:hypothetical protein